MIGIPLVLFGFLLIVIPLLIAIPFLVAGGFRRSGMNYTALIVSGIIGAVMIVLGFLALALKI